MRNIAPVLTLATVASLLAQSSSSYRITHTYMLGGDGSWDYVVPDPPQHRLFIARQNRVMVVDEDSGTVVRRWSTSTCKQPVSMATNMEAPA